MKTIVGNWKMHLGVRESVALARGVLRSMRGKEQGPEIVLCPPFTSLSEVHKVLARTKVKLGAQNVGTERSGAQTGEVSTLMLEDVGASFVILGHSERRAQFGETDKLIAEKLAHVLTTHITPIVCVGETKSERKNATAFVKKQIVNATAGLTVPRSKTVLFAYEPVWAIGTGEAADAQEVAEMHKLIKLIAAKCLDKKPEAIRVLYGGSVDGKNAYNYLREPEIDGLLVGGASIKLNQFTDIIESGREVISVQNG